MRKPEMNNDNTDYTTWHKLKVFRTFQHVVQMHALIYLQGKIFSLFFRSLNNTPPPVINVIHVCIQLLLHIP